MGKFGGKKKDSKTISEDSYSETGLTKVERGRRKQASTLKMKW